MITSIDIDQNEEQVFPLSSDPTIEVVIYKGISLIITEENIFSLFSKNQFIKTPDKDEHVYTEEKEKLVLTTEYYEMICRLFDQGYVVTKA